jgi:electron transfer flavoprotein alpha subunit
LNTSAEALVLGTVDYDLATLGKYGVTKVHQVVNESLNHVDAQVFAKVIAEAATASNASVIIFLTTKQVKQLQQELQLV